MIDYPAVQPPGWYYAQGDPPGTQRYWDGYQWQGAPQGFPAEGHAAAGGPKIADAGSRLLARFIDLILFAVVSSSLTLTIGGEVAFRGGSSGSVVLASFLVGVTTCVYEVYLVANGGATLGKKALSLKVVMEDGSDVDYRVSAMRYSPYILSTLVGVVPVLGGLVQVLVTLIGLVSYVLILTDPKRQALWDKLAATLVVKA